MRNKSSCLAMNKWLRLVVSIILCESAGGIGAIFTAPNIATWYITLNKPFFNPPNFIFAPVWTILYFLMGVALFLIWEIKAKDKQKAKKTAIQIFFIQLILNVVWSVVFFGLHSALGGVLIIIILWVAILETIKHFTKLNSKAGYLLYPYLIWVSFALILNISIYLINR